MFFENMGYAAGKDGAPLTGVHLALFIAFCINLFVVLSVSVVSLCCVPPAKISKKMKFAKLISLLDLYAVFLPDKNQKKEKHNDDGDDANATHSKCNKIKRSVSGAVMTLLTIWFLFGALLILVKQRSRLVPFTITESQELSSVLSTTNQYFNMATVFKVYAPNQSYCSYFAQKATMSVSGTDVTQVGNVQYKAVQTDRYSSAADCYVYQEWKTTANPTGFQSPVSVSVQIGDSSLYSSSAFFAFVSLPWDSRGDDWWVAKEGTLETQTPKEMVNYLKGLGGFCARVQSSASVSLTVEPKSFQYPMASYYGSSRQNPIFSNIVHFSKQIERWSSPTSQQKYDVTLNFTPRRAFYAEGQSSFNTLLLAGLTIVVVLLVCTWIRKIVMTFASLCQKSLRARLVALLCLFLVMCGAYGVMGWLIAQNMLFPDATISTLSLSSVIYTSLLLFSAFIHVAVYHSKYKPDPSATEPVSTFPTVQTYETNFQSVPQHVPYPETVPLYSPAHNPNVSLNVVYRPHPTYQ